MLPLAESRASALNFRVSMSLDMPARAGLNWTVRLMEVPACRTKGSCNAGVKDRRAGFCRMVALLSSIEAGRQGVGVLKNAKFRGVSCVEKSGNSSRVSDASVCVCAFVCLRVRACVCVCVREREREREKPLQLSPLLSRSI
jgi:hypothetical protein